MCEREPSHRLGAQISHRPHTFLLLTTTLLLLLASDLELLVVELEVGLHLLNGLVGDGEAEFLRGQRRSVRRCSKANLFGDREAEP